MYIVHATMGHLYFEYTVAICCFPTSAFWGNGEGEI